MFILGGISNLPYNGSRSQERIMEKFVIEGGIPLQGDVTPSGNKNAALPILAACLLTDEAVILGRGATCSTAS